MHKYACLMLILICLLTSVEVWGQEDVRVAVMPVQISADGAKLEQLAHISKGLVTIIVTGLAEQGLLVLTMGDNVLALDDDAAQAQAREIGANYLFNARVINTGETYSLIGQLQGLTANTTSSKRFTVDVGASNQLPQGVEQLLQLTTDHLYSSGSPVVSVSISGNTMIDSQAILNSLRIQAGGFYNETMVTSDIKRIYGLGYFDDVRVEVIDVPGGKKVHYLVQERNQLSRIVYRGNKKFDKEELDEVANIKVNDIPSERNINDSIENIKQLYTDKGYSNVEIMTSVEDDGNGRGVLVYNISEGGKIYIQEIVFAGNEFFSNWTLSNAIETTSRNFLLSWFDGSGKLNQEKLSGDSQKIQSLYSNNGFLQAQVGDPQTSNNEDGDGGLIITFPIIEGIRYQVGTVSIGGSILPDDDIETMVTYLEVGNEIWFNREVMQEDAKALQTYYSDQGYAHNSVEPKITPAEGSENTLDVEFVVQPKNKVYFDRITIVGNDKTRDKVIRRQLSVAEGDQFSSSLIQSSQNSLMQSTYFEQVNLSPGPSDTDDKMNLRVEVKEKSTGAFQIGGGYSNYNSLFGVISLTQDNLFGYGRRVSVEANIGSKNQLFDISFTDPWVFDIPLTMGVDVFRYQNEYDDYTKSATGAALRAGYPVWNNFYLSGRLSFEKIDITGVGPNSAQALQDLAGFDTDTIATISLRRDTRNHFFFPSRGAINRLSYAKALKLLGGKASFSRYEAEVAHWWPLPFFKGASIMGHGEIGYMTEDAKGGLPLYEKYLLGGINSVRGYDWFSISPKDPITGEALGGEKMLTLNAEIAIPLLMEEGVYGVVFFDAGQVWDKKDQYSLSDLRRSYGGGLRYLSPMGPFRVEYGVPLDAEPGKSKGEWEFTMGSMF